MVLQGPTVFPILFSLVVGGSLRSLALYRLQAGEKIGLLDLLFGSTTLGNMIETLCERNFRYFDIIGVALLILWALSPLGGQATLRVIGYHEVAVKRPLKLAYLDYSRSYFPVELQGSDLGPIPIPLASAFVSSLSSPLSFQNSASDLWGNVKTPVLESLPGYGSVADGEWVAVPRNSEETWYASLIGVPIANIPQTGSTRFQMEVAYWGMECPGFGNGTEQDTEYRGMALNKTMSQCPDGQFICSVDDELWDLQGSTSSWGWIVSNNNSLESTNRRCYSNTTSNPPRRQFMYYSWNSDYNPTVAKCSIWTSFVEVSVDCNGWDCGVDRMRRSLQHPSVYSTAATSLDQCPWNNTLPYPRVAKFVNLMISAVDNELFRSATPGLLQYYIQHPNRTQGVYHDIYLTELGNDTFTRRFSVLLNTYWSSVYNYNLTSQGHADALLFDHNYYIDNPVSNVTGITAVSEQRFAFNRAWYTVLVISTSVLFLAAVFKLVLDLYIFIPNLQLNASTLLRGNVANCPSLPYGGSAMDDGDRSRLLRHRKVRFGHRIMVAGHADELGMGELEEEEGFIKRVKKGRNIINYCTSQHPPPPFAHNNALSNRLLN